MAPYQPFGAPNRLTINGYPPPQDVIYPTINSTSTLETKVGEDSRQLSRTPSPTPSEVKELKTGAIDWKTLRTRTFWFRREWLWYYVALVVILVITALITLYHKQIVDWLTPVTRWLHDLKFGWLVPIGVLFVISFPPLFGHEIVAILCGLVWGLWVGFGIVAAGTFVGEVGNFYAFKYCCRSRGEKLERTKITYACLARVVRDGGFKIALIARLSAIPGHFTTAVFSTCGMGIIVFSIAAILSMPKQFITVYLGVILAQSNSGQQDKKSRIISDVVLAVTFIITALAMWYILRQMNKVKPQVIYDRRKARQAKLSRTGFSPYSNAESATASTDVFNPNGSDSDIPLNPTDIRYQQWDRHGKAVGYVTDPSVIYMPKPSAQSNAAFIPLPYPRDVEEAGGRPFAGHGREDSADVVGWDTANGVSDPPAREYAPGVVHVRHSHSGPRVAQGLHNPDSPHHQRTAFASGMDPAQTPTQATFVNEWPAASKHAAASHTPQSPFDEAYVGFDAPYTPYTHGHGHAHPTDATFRMAFTSSPVHDDDLRTPIPHSMSTRGAASSPPQNQSHTPNLR